MSGPGSVSSVHTCGVGSPFGYDETDMLIILELAGHHLLLGGEPGAGKSNALSLVVATAALDPYTSAVVLRRQAGRVRRLATVRARRFVGRRHRSGDGGLGERHGARWRTRYTCTPRPRACARSTRTPDRARRRRHRRAGPLPQGKSKAATSSSKYSATSWPGAGPPASWWSPPPRSRAPTWCPTSIRDLFGCRLACRSSTRDASDTVLGGWMGRRGLLRLRPRPHPSGCRATSSPRARSHGGCGASCLVRPPVRALARRAEQLRGTANDATCKTGGRRRVVDGILARLHGPDGFDAFRAQVRATRACRRPVRLSGETIGDRRKDPPRGRSSTARDLPDGVLLKACGTRRETLCPPCASLYPRGRLRSGGCRASRWARAIPEESCTTIRPCFLTLTAPFFSGPCTTAGADGSCHRGRHHVVRTGSPRLRGSPRRSRRGPRLRRCARPATTTRAPVLFNGGSPSSGGAR